MFLHPVAFAPVNVYVVVIVGDTTALLPVKEPGIQVYVLAPPPVKVALLPEQIAVGLTTAVTVGFGLTIKVMVLVLEQVPVAPRTVYVVLVVGVTTMLVPVIAPGFQV